MLPDRANARYYKQIFTSYFGNIIGDLNWLYLKIAYSILLIFVSSNFIKTNFGFVEFYSTLGYCRKNQNDKVECN